MIVPMKKVSLIVLDGERKNALKKLRKLGLLHIEIKEGKGPRLVELKEQIASLEKGMFAGFSSEEKECFYSCLQKLSGNLEQMLQQAKKEDWN